MNIKITNKDGITLKTKDTYIREDISVAVDESILGGGIEIPPVTDLVIDKGIASWKRPDITSLIKYNPILSYIVNVNGSEIETSSTNQSVASYLIEGVNVISVKVKALLTSNSVENNTTFEYSVAKLGVAILEAKLPIASYGMASSRVGSNIYLLGGVNLSRGEIFKFNTTNETIETLDVTLPTRLYYSEAISVGSKIYLFGGINNTWEKSIRVFDTLTEPTTTLSTTLPEGLDQVGLGVVGSNVYIFGGRYQNNGYRNTIYKFNTTTETIEKLSVTLPQTNSSMCVATIGTDIYLLGGTNGKYLNNHFNTILKFDSTTETITTLSTTLPYRVANMGYATINSNIYLFAGSNADGNLNSVIEFNTDENIATKLEVEMPEAIKYCEAVAIEKTIYIFGGRSTSNVDTILKFTA